jgi:hypothetical protein
LSIIRLPNDHHGLAPRPGAPTPRAMVAENDLALGAWLKRSQAVACTGKIRRYSSSKTMRRAGPDHVDSHRSIMLVASPFAKRAFVDHTFYTTSGVLRTIELILGLPPMSHYDAAATPLYNAFVGTPNLALYRRSDARVPIDERQSADGISGIAVGRDGFFDRGSARPKDCSTKSSGGR